MKSVVVADLSYAWVREVRQRTAHLSHLLHWTDEGEAWLRSWLDIDPSKLKSPAVAWAPYVFFVHWSKHVPKAMTDTLECVNFHCTPLPYGRGGHPIENMIRRGHRETTMTAHRMTDELDAGPVYGTVGAISLVGTKEQILQRFVEPVVGLMSHIATADPKVKPRRQHGTVVKFNRLTPTNYEKFWRERARRQQMVTGANR